jgi:hypothetical protein
MTVLAAQRLVGMSPPSAAAFYAAASAAFTSSTGIQAGFRSADPAAIFQEIEGYLLYGYNVSLHMFDYDFARALCIISAVHLAHLERLAYVCPAESGTYVCMSVAVHVRRGG